MKTKSSRLVIRGAYFYKIKLKITLISTAPYGRNSEVLGTCERLAQGRYSVIRQPGVKSTTCWLQIQSHNRYATEPHGCEIVNWHVCALG